ncbi:MAG: DUF418 domain-containing protein [Planctomycetota bacterium]|jgi:uncharacterized protein|nr:DUF418 domain-containing protein [Planctomycetota bacterium]MDP6762496.1 DUF418 domain-containing protein [Planctomycetota bacterium]MDP6988516.1 DUF418 domain-containing protein [Planctomycetota bacterium]
MDETRADISRPRLASLDALRGVAIFGIFMVNIQFMGMPFDWATDPHRTGGAGAWAWALTSTFFESNFVAIFSMLFGAGLVLQQSHAEERGAPFAAPYLRRMGLLMLMGLAHGVLLFMGDILLLYSVLGVVLFLFRGAQARTLLFIGAVPLLVSLIGAVVIHSLGPMETSAEEISAQIQRVREGPLTDLLAGRAVAFVFWMILSSFWFNWRVLSMLFLGAALMKLGFFEERRRGWHARAALVGLPLGGALEALVTWSRWADTDGVVAGLWESAHQLSSLLLALGYTGGIILIVHSGALRSLVRGVSCVGRTSLSNYVLQSVVANVLFTFMGFAWFGECTRWGLVGIVFVTYGLQIVASSLWMRRFRMGPLEWAWRTATYLRRPPLLR